VSIEFRLGLTTVAFCVWMAMADCAWGQTNDLPRHAVIGLQVAPPDLNKPEDPVKNPPTIKIRHSRWRRVKSQEFRWETSC